MLNDDNLAVEVGSVKYEDDDDEVVDEVEGKRRFRDVVRFEFITNLLALVCPPFETDEIDLEGDDENESSLSLFIDLDLDLFS